MQDDFTRFVKDRFGVLLTLISSLPLLANYFKLFELGDTYEKPVVLITTLTCGLIFFVLQSKRYVIAGKHTRAWLFTGFAVTMIGTVTFFIYLLNPELLSPAQNAILFMITFLFLLNGSAILLLQIFVNEEERKRMVYEIVSTLNHDQWEKFMVFCKVFVSGKDAVVGETRAQRKVIRTQRKAFRKSLQHIVNLTANMFTKIHKGTFEIRGKEMDDIYKYYMEAVSKEFKAVSFDDLTYWMNEDESQEYFKTNIDIIKRGCAVERMFIVKEKSKLFEAREAVRKQLSAGIRVRILFMSDELFRNFSRLDLDFGLFDEFAVSSWNFVRGRVFRITQEKDVCDKFKGIYENLQIMCEPIVKGSPQKVFRKVEEFDAWLRPEEVQMATDHIS